LNDAAINGIDLGLESEEVQLDEGLADGDDINLDSFQNVGTEKSGADGSRDLSGNGFAAIVEDGEMVVEEI
jgi:hypothetical protein